VRTGVTDRATHRQSRVLLILQPNACWPHILTVATLVALYPSIHRQDTLHLVGVVRLMIACDHLGEPRLVSILDRVGFTLDF